MKKALLTMLTVAAVTGSSLTVSAAPERMPDGGMFDAEYYAQNNPDVATVLGTDRDVLYDHYLSWGRNEGRQPYEPGTEQSVPAPAPVVNKASGQSISEVLLLYHSFYRDFWNTFLLSDSRPIKFYMQNLATGKIYPERDFTYDAQGNLMGKMTEGVEYDAEGRLAKIEESPYFQLDESGRLISIVHPPRTINGNWQGRFYYNEQGFLTKIIKEDPHSGEVFHNDEFFYNEQNKIVQRKRKFTDREWGQEEELYFYDEQGRLVRMENTAFDDEGVYRYEKVTINYDDQGRMANVLYSHEEIASRYMVTYIYE